ncbi:TadE/TadG family type IV pilus assembly protein [Vibrio olivae]|uniref:TadE/TadG family type IV pilus assembly protein n=1 Tax=Vibrio olivae TaxID=1243002 RepID=A0ABV5HM78_9VIBR
MDYKILTVSYSRRVKQKGSVAIETVCLLPLIILLIFSVIHYCMIFFAISIFDFAAKESIRQTLSYVDESCYFSASGCTDSNILEQVKPIILDNASQVIKGFTHANGDGLGKLFGVTLPAAENLIQISTIAEGGCCQVSISLTDYHSTPFLPLNIVDGLIPGENSVFPSQLSATAAMKIN